MGKKLTSIILAVLLFGGIVPVFAADYLEGGLQAYEDFESNGEYRDSAYGIGRAKALKATQSSHAVYRQSFEGLIVHQGSDTVTGTYYNYATEGPDAKLVIDYDIYFDDLVEAGTSLVVRLFDLDEFTNTYPVALTFSGSAGTITAKNTYAFAIQDDRWYHMRHVVSGTNSNGGRNCKHDLYINGELVISGEAFLSTNYYKFPKLDTLQLIVSAITGTASNATAYLDNVRVYKANSNAKMPVNNGGLLTEIRNAEVILNQAVFGTGVEEYAPELETAMQEELEVAKSVYATSEDTDEVAAAKTKLEAFCRSTFVPNGDLVEIGEPVFYNADTDKVVTSTAGASTIRAEIPVSVSRFADQNGMKLSVYLLAVTESEDGGEKVEALSSEVAEVLLPDIEQKVRLTYTLEPTLDVSGIASDASLKMVVIESLDSLVPYYLYNDATAACDNVSVAQKNMYDANNATTVFTAESTSDDNLVIAVYVDGKLIYLNQCVADKDGVCSFYIDTTAITEETTLQYEIYSTAAGKIYSGNGSVYPIALMNSVLSDIYTLEENAAAAVVMKSSIPLGLNKEILSLYSANNLVSTEALAAIRKRLYTVEELEELQTIFMEYSRKYAMNYLQTDVLLGEILNENEKNSITSLIGIGSDADAYGDKSAARYVSYLAMESDEKRAVYNFIRKRQDYQPDEQRTVFETAVVLAQVNTAVSTDKIISSIAANADLLTNAKALLALNGNKQRTAASAILNYGDFTSLEKLNDYIKVVTEKVDNNGGGISGGGSSGGNFGNKITGGSATLATPTGTIEPIETEVVEINADMTNFTDIENHTWAKNAIDFLTQKGVLNGKGNNLFAPDDMVTREEFVKMVTLLFDIQADTEECVFEDVSDDAWYRPYVISAYENGVINGVSENLFGIGQSLTREQMVTIAYQAATKAGVTFNNEVYYVPFVDTDAVEAYAETALHILAGNGIVNGMGENMFMPKETCTRAEAAKVLHGVYIVNYR